ncbi:hypothetical protein [Nostoc favosum]|uniref:Uncharacterized protein n=1 Tax=Nostoc favosum CHAB5714 TaxID=2780399 RepID=A0ABS8I9I9_9NOSO|nr:hypothetical protein [Nostoc favosum]MCC5600875.1 hypothetical protein [Nostoc favosum CHAB5714]
MFLLAVNYLLLTASIGLNGKQQMPTRPDGSFQSMQDNQNFEQHQKQ